MNQTELGTIAGVQKNTQANYESGLRTPDAGYLAALLKAGIDVMYVLTGVRSPGAAEAFAALSRDEADLLESYRRVDPQDRAAVRRLLDSVAGVIRKAN